MKNLSMSKKFTAVIIVFVLTLGVIFAAGMTGMHRIMNSSQYIIEEVSMRRLTSRRLIGYTTDIEGKLKIMALTKDDKERLAVSQALETVMKDSKTSFDELNQLKDEESRPLIETATTDFNKWHGVMEEARQMVLNGKSEQALTKNKEAEAIRLELFDMLSKSNDHAKAQMGKAVQDNRTLFDDLVYSTILISLIGLGIGISLAFLVVRAITRAVNQTVETLTDASHQVASAAEQVSSSSQNLSQAATEQASSLEETSSAIEEMNSMVGRNTESARESSHVASKGVDSAKRGQRVVQTMMESMTAINEANQAVVRQTDESNQQIQEIVAVIHEIGEKTKVINEIVFQTKLLSFNASVEAARAGEHGKGFAVVAEEVGNLAQMSGNAAKDITSLLDGSINKVQRIVQESKSRIESIVLDNAKKVDAGNRIARECGEVLDEIAKGIQNVSHMADSIAGASDEQARGIQEINRAVTQLDQVTQVNAAASEEAAAASEELSAQAQNMRVVVAELARIVNGSQAQTPPLEFATPVRPSPAEPKPKTAVKAKTKTSSVIHLGSQTPKTRAAPMSGRMASGGTEIPSEHDERFRDI